MKSYLSPKTVIKKSKIAGKGLFAKMSLRKGELVGIKNCHLLDYKAMQKLKSVIGDSYLQIADDFVLAPKKKSEISKIMMYLNHSCEPNIAVRGEISFVAMRNIKSGEELAVDYATIDNEKYSMKCSCGAKNCRGTISGYDWKNKKLQKKYQGHFAAYLQAKIEGSF